jgi:hypothetical protein
VCCDTGHGLGVDACVLLPECLVHTHSIRKDYFKVACLHSFVRRCTGKPAPSEAKLTCDCCALPGVAVLWCVLQHIMASA